MLDGDRLRITTTGNADTPLVSSQIPLLAIDVWEHAYYPDYQNRRVDYIAAYLTAGRVQSPPASDARSIAMTDSPTSPSPRTSPQARLPHSRTPR